MIGVSSWRRTYDINVLKVLARKHRCSGTGLSPAHIDSIEEMEVFEALTLAVEKYRKTND